MQHSVVNIATKYAELSDLRQDQKRFIAKDFIEFAKTNSKKYGLIKNENDLLVSTWYSNDLIEDYRKTL